MKPRHTPFQATSYEYPLKKGYKSKIYHASTVWKGGLNIYLKYG